MHGDGRTPNVKPSQWSSSSVRARRLASGSTYSWQPRTRRDSAYRPRKSSFASISTFVDRDWSSPVKYFELFTDAFIYIFLFPETNKDGIPSLEPIFTICDVVSLKTDASNFRIPQMVCISHHADVLLSHLVYMHVLSTDPVLVFVYGYDPPPAPPGAPPAVPPVVPLVPSHTTLPRIQVSTIFSLSLPVRQTEKILMKDHADWRLWVCPE